MQKEQVNARLKDGVTEKIDLYRVAMEESRGSYLALIAEWWVAQGCPPVNDYESKLREKHSARRAS